MNIYVGNLSYDMTDGDLEKAFSAFGRVKSAKVINDKFSGKSKGFGFVEMETRGDGEKAINDLNGTELKGRTIVVNEARPREEGRGPSFGGGGGGGGGRSGGGRSGGGERRGGGGGGGHGGNRW